MSKSLPTTAAVVRNFFRSNDEALAALSGPAAATVLPGARGRLHPEAREAFNAAVPRSQRYDEGTPKTVPLSFVHVQPSGRKVRKVAAVTEDARRALAREAGAHVGARGPLSKAAMLAAAEQYAKTLV